MSQCIKCDKKAIDNADYCEECQEKAFSRIGGVLYLPAISLVLSVVMLGVSVFSTARLLLDNYSVLPAIITNMLSFELIGFFLLHILAIYTAFCFFTKRKKLPHLYISLIVCNLLFCLADMYLGYYYLDTRIDYESARPVIRSVVSACIWIPYFLVSKRVKGTFIH
ncbi:DUF2569 domain-containing protein [Enterobacteriaceae bacterium 4M9]|nr:DUF2569 domain-containing protein [Enterobacteriaceae bacterium 4M9]